VQGDFGAPRCHIALLSDLTLKREVEKAERRIQKLEDLRVMALGIAHEIRNPLASIRGCVQEMGRLIHGEAKVAQYMEIACRESDRLDGILENFLLYARSGPLDLACLDISEVIDEAVMLLKSRSDLGPRSIVWSAPAARPRILGDRNRLIQVFLNLGINAIEATSTEEGRISISLHSKLFARVGGHGVTQEPVPGVEVEIADNGKGLSREDMTRVFTPFFTTKPRGNGLGLCIVDRIMREHGGVTDVSSTENGGTVLHLWFPVIESAFLTPTLAEQMSPQEAGCCVHE
jgi:signal transduction histidine kinase